MLEIGHKIKEPKQLRVGCMLHCDGEVMIVTRTGNTYATVQNGTVYFQGHPSLDGLQKSLEDCGWVELESGTILTYTRP